MIRKFVARSVSRAGYTIVRNQDDDFDPSLFPEANENDRKILRSVRPFTMTSQERVWALIEAVRYVAKNDIAGDLVECGVWRGGSAMAMMMALLATEKPNRRVWLFDTFSGMTAPTSRDIDVATKKSAAAILVEAKSVTTDLVWAFASQSEVSANISTTGYPADLVRFVKGDILETLKEKLPDEIALLRLDTDWYESTAYELEVLYPRLVSGGVCIVDDYGHWGGSQEAVDEYFTAREFVPLFSRIDYSGRLFVKP